MKDAEASRKVRDMFEPTTSKATTKRKLSRIPPEKLTELRVTFIRTAFYKILGEAQSQTHFKYIPSSADVYDNNKNARMLSENLYQESSDWLASPFNGENTNDFAVLKRIGSELFVFPPHSKFFCRDVLEIKLNADLLGKFDLILLDPPWWNKYIRRKRAKCLQDGYKMMYNECLTEIPIDKLLAPGGVIAVWCTNSKQNLEELKHKLLPFWGTKQVAQWVWMKVTLSGQPVCPFSEPPGKQPFEQLIFAVRPDEVNTFPRPPDEKIFMSVPSSIHSHKPPIIDMVKPYLPPEPRCMEIFARYLLPNWTSWGLEVLKLQHASLFEENKISII
ncbi:N(6)-adenine-specific methyltransferase METTL4 [Frankliniella fusca]|uniref:N(6)-adenine-specific methyltransferase METTL4 n=1 Tax=Frankliniella fusca TaxID=407009 RepID=A0AAE1GTU4_9NEOP|nr:N(6)-adenine-specific methyltransferase METTL4 [Frankliniella fusca]KAK3911181.1 N(6)-adenine-specific methyltransferase METTL4 [Frankliniella fusca]